MNLPAPVIAVVSFAAMAVLPLTGCAPSRAPGRPPALSSQGPAVDEAAEAAQRLAAAEAHVRAHRYDPALAEARYAFQLRQRLFGPSHPSTEEAAILVGYALEGTRQYAEAVSVLSGVLAARRARFRSNAAEFAPVLEPLVRSLVALGQYPDARAPAAQLVAVREAKNGLGHPDHVRALVQLATIHSALCEHRQAESALLTALRSIESSTQRATELSTVLKQLSGIRRSQGELADARAFALRAIEVLPIQSVEHSEARLARMVDLAYLLEDGGDYQGAIGWFEKAAILEQTRHPIQVDIATKLAAAWARAGQGDKARAVWEHYRIARYALPMPPGATSARLPLPSFGPPVTPDGPSKEKESKSTACVPHKSSILGGVSNAASVVAGMRAGFRNCYNAELVRNRDLEASVRIVGTLNAAGGVTTVTVDVFDGVPEQLVTCLMGLFLQARFAAPEGGQATVVVPVTLVQQH